MTNYTRSKTTDNQSTDQQLRSPIPIHSTPTSTTDLPIKTSLMRFSWSGVGQLPTLEPLACQSGESSEDGGSVESYLGERSAVHRLASGQDNSRSGVNLDRVDLVPAKIRTSRSESRSAGAHPVLQYLCFHAECARHLWRLASKSLRNPNYLNSMPVSNERFLSPYERSAFKFRVEAFNLLNHPPFQPARSKPVLPSTFGKITSAGDPRILQLVGRLEF